MAKFYDRAWVSTATAGTGTVTLGAAVTGYYTFAEAGVANADVVSYVIEDGDDFEYGIGTYTSAGTTLTRTTVTGSKIGGVAGTSKINLSGNARVFITARKADLLSVSETQTANRIFSGPSSGAAAVPAFRALVSDDIPSLAASKITSGEFDDARIGDDLPIAKITDGLGWLKLYEQTASASATIDFNETSHPNMFNGTYDEIEIRFFNVLPVNNDADFGFRTAQDAGGATFATSGYNFTAWGVDVGGGFDGNSFSAGVYVALTDNDTGDQMSNVANEVGAGVIKMWRLNTASIVCRFEFTYFSSDSSQGTQITGGGIILAGPLTGVRFLMDSGGISTGTFRVYGLRH
jgi:hypothetical protein